jgi:HAD superfamily hydrolase (TIGR01484 family)
LDHNRGCRFRARAKTAHCTLSFLEQCCRLVPLRHPTSLSGFGFPRGTHQILRDYDCVGSRHSQEVHLYFLALAVDFDGTIAHDGCVDASTCNSLKGLKETGRRLVLVTGRELRHLANSSLDLFDRVVAENGAVVYDPSTKRQHVVADKPAADLVRALKEKKVEPLSIGESIIATWSPNETTVLETIRDLGLEYQTIFNEGAVMALPSGINKATGLKTALAELELSAHNVIGVGDAENDFAFLEACGCSAAVGNATPTLKNAVDVVLEGCWGHGVMELVEQVVAKDAGIIPAGRHGIRVGIDRNGDEVQIVPYVGSLLISGSSGIGKSKLATALTERMVEKQFQFCVFDREGDYDELDHAISVGNMKASPNEEQALKLLKKSATNTVVNTQALGIAARPGFFTTLLPRVLSLRARTGRPHWLLIDEAHHLLPAGRNELSGILPKHLPGVILITVHPEAVAVEALRTVKAVLALGPEAGTVVATYCKAIGALAPRGLPQPDENEGLYYTVAGDARLLRLDRPQQEHKRHTRKYAEGRLGSDRSFYFRGPDNALNLRAHNLTIFLEMAAGIDDRTWEHHRQAGDYSRWFREAIKDEQLAHESGEIERDAGLDPKESRDRIAQAVSRRYMAPTQEMD